MSPKLDLIAQFSALAEQVIEPLTTGCARLRVLAHAHPPSARDLIALMRAQLDEIERSIEGN